MIPRKKEVTKADKVTPQQKTNKPKKTKSNAIPTRLPKSEYDSDGKPILNIPGIDDIELGDTIERFLY